MYLKKKWSVLYNSTSLIRVNEKTSFTAAAQQVSTKITVLAEIIRAESSANLHNVMWG